MTSGIHRRAALRALSLVVILTLSIVISCRSVENYFGYCRADGRFLSDKEKEDAAILYVLENYPPVIEIPVGSRNFQRPPNAVPYVSLAEFRASNPRCCALVPVLPKSGYAPPFDVRIMGGFSTFVRLNYIVRLVAADGEQIARPVENHVAVSNCGRTSSGI